MYAPEHEFWALGLLSQCPDTQKTKPNSQGYFKDQQRMKIIVKIHKGITICQAWLIVWSENTPSDEVSREKLLSNGLSLRVSWQALVRSFHLFLFSVYGCDACTCMSVWHMCALQRPELSRRFFGSRVLDDGKAPYGCWEWSLGLRNSSQS